MPINHDYSGLRCLQILFSQFRRDVNFPALVTDELKAKYLENHTATLLEVSDAHQLQPELWKLADFPENYDGPALLSLKNNNWVLLMNLKQLKTQEKAVIYDPLQPSQQNTLSVPVDKIFERAGETLIIFRNLREIDLTKHSALFALCSIASHHNVAMNPVRVMHEYAVGEDELNEQLLMEIAINYGFRVKKKTA